MKASCIIKTVKNYLKTSAPDVRLAYLFGSYANGSNTATSDIDLAVLFDYYLKKKAIYDKYLLLIAELSSVLKTDNIDVVLLNYIDDPLLLSEIVSKGIVIYDPDNLHIEMYVKTVSMYSDFLIWRRELDKMYNQKQ